MENEVSKSAVQSPLDAHFPEDAPQNGKVASKALDAYFVLRSQVCNCVQADATSQLLLCEYNNSYRQSARSGRPFWGPLPARAPPVVVRT